MLAIPDPDIAAALRLIRENAYNGINVGDLLRECSCHGGCSRSVSGGSFADAHQEIIVKLARVLQLFAETSLPLSAIARQAGSRHADT